MAAGDGKHGSSVSHHCCRMGEELTMTWQRGNVMEPLWTAAYPQCNSFIREITEFCLHSLYSMSEAKLTFKQQVCFHHYSSAVTSPVWHHQVTCVQKNVGLATLILNFKYPYDRVTWLGLFLSAHLDVVGSFGLCVHHQEAVIQVLLCPPPEEEEEEDEDKMKASNNMETERPISIELPASNYYHLNRWNDPSCLNSTL